MRETWDAVIVGAGPAGSVSAYLLARRGWRVLLVEKSAWPREKVCGGCVNAAAVGMLREMGLGRVLRDGTGEVNGLTRFTLNVRGRELSMPLPAGVAIGRDVLDRQLVEAAVEAGAEFRSQCATRLLPVKPGDAFRTLSTDGEPLRARVVLACDGIAGTLLEDEAWAEWVVARGAWFGVSATLRLEESALPRHTIGMNVGTGGYVGTARLEGEAVHVAAALDGAACKEAGGPAKHMERILKECGQGFAGSVAEVKVRGTGLLTRRRKALGGERVLAVGDACGYVEPFTGEGIAWAIRGAREVAALLGAAGEWSPEVVDAWERVHRAAVARQQRGCRMLRQLVHHPRVAGAGLCVAQVVPRVAGVIARRIGQQKFLPNLEIEGVGA